MILEHPSLSSKVLTLQFGIVNRKADGESQQLFLQQATRIESRIQMNYFLNIE
jgi:hypothetical protein